MSRAKIFLNFYLDASIHVALAVLSLTLISYSNIGIVIKKEVLCFVFFGTIWSYNYIKYGVQLRPQQNDNYPYGHIIFFLSIISLIISTYFFSFLNKNTWLFVLLLLILVGSYTLPVTNKGQNLRSLGITKVFLVALVWAGTTVVIPILNAGLQLSWDLGLAIFQRIILVLILMIPFEIRDLNIDKPNLKTIPQRFGVQKTKIGGVILVFCYFGSIYFQDALSNPLIAQKALVSILLLFVIGATQKKQSKYFAAFYIEAIPILWALVVIMLEVN